MNPTGSVLPVIDQKVIQLFALVSEALSRATFTEEALQSRPFQGDELRYLVGLLLIIPELERSGDLAEHVAHRAVEHLGISMSPRGRGIVQLMTEVANEMWLAAADAFGERKRVADRLVKADEEMDILHDRLTREVGKEEMPASIAAQVTLLARFYERLGDHAVNLARRIELLSDTPASRGSEAWTVATGHRHFVAAKMSHPH